MNKCFFHINLRGNLWWWWRNCFVCSCGVCVHDEKGCHVSLGLLSDVRWYGSPLSSASSVNSQPCLVGSTLEHIKNKFTYCKHYWFSRCETTRKRAEILHQQFPVHPWQNQLPFIHWYHFTLSDQSACISTHWWQLDWEGDSWGRELEANWEWFSSVSFKSLSALSHFPL